MSWLSELLFSANDVTLRVVEGPRLLPFFYRLSRVDKRDENVNVGTPSAPIWMLWAILNLPHAALPFCLAQTSSW